MSAPGLVRHVRFVLRRKRDFRNLRLGGSDRKFDLLQRIQVEVFWRGDSRRVRTVKTGAEEKRLVPMLFHESRHGARGDAIGMLFIRGVLQGVPLLFEAGVWI